MILYFLLVHLDLVRSQSNLPNSPVPGVCYSTCNDAYLVLQKVGSNNTSLLCQEDSSFMQYKQACEECVQNRNASTAALGAYLGICEPANPTVTGTSIIQLITTNVAISTEIGGVGTVLTAQVVYPSYPGDLATTAVSTATTLVGGRSTVSTIYATYTELPRPLFGTIPPTTSTTQSPSATANQTSGPSIPAPSAPAPAPATTRSLAWMAGPVVGGVAAIAVVAALSWWWRRKRRQTTHSDGAANPTTREGNGQFEKPELPASPALGAGRRQEIGGNPILELEAGGGGGGAVYEADAGQDCGSLGQGAAQVVRT
ncbi:hypothetical protein PG988_003483 [Apiospora saccharicola]